MAISRKTQKDVGKYKTKFIGPFTSRQCLFIGIGGVCSLFAGVPLELVGTDFITIAIVCFIIVIPFYLLGNADVYGLTMEQFLISYYNYHLTRPKIRLYQTENTLDFIKDELTEEEKMKELERKKNKEKKHVADPDYPDFL